MLSPILELPIILQGKTPPSLRRCNACYKRAWNLEALSFMTVMLICIKTSMRWAIFYQHLYKWHKLKSLQVTVQWLLYALILIGMDHSSDSSSPTKEAEDLDEQSNSSAGATPEGDSWVTSKSPLISSQTARRLGQFSCPEIQACHPAQNPLNAPCKSLYICECIYTGWGGNSEAGMFWVNTVAFVQLSG